jgi:hypothetical protein
MKRLAIVADDALAARALAQPQNRRGRRGTRALPKLDRTWAARAVSRVAHRQGLDGGRARRAGPTSISVLRSDEVAG